MRSGGKTKFSGASILVTALVLAFVAAPAFGAIWGIKSHDPVSGPPVTLFHFAENGTGFTVVGVVRMGGQQIDADGLAITAKADLYGFRITSTGSTLVSISKITAAASARGPELPGVDIRGAVCCTSEKLACLDAAGNAIVYVNPSTGELVGSPLPLTLDGQPFDLSDASDIGQRGDSMMVISSGSTLYEVDSATGELQQVFEDVVIGTDGLVPSLAGITFTRSAGAFSTLYAYDVSEDDDIFAYDSDMFYERTVLFPDIIPSYNAGRGDLAAQPDLADTFRILNRTALEKLTRQASHTHRFTVWGKVTETDDGLLLDDGSGSPVQVIASAAPGVGDGDFAEASGVLHYSESGAILLSSPADISLLAEDDGS